MGRPKAAVLNRDDPSFDYLSSLNPVETVSYAVKRPADVYAENPIIDHRGTRFRVRTFAGDIELNLRLRGGCSMSIILWPPLPQGWLTG